MFLPIEMCRYKFIVNVSKVFCVFCCIFYVVGNVLKYRHQGKINKKEEIVHTMYSSYIIYSIPLLVLEIDLEPCALT